MYFRCTDVVKGAMSASSHKKEVGDPLFCCTIRLQEYQSFDRLRVPLEAFRVRRISSCSD